MEAEFLSILRARLPQGKRQLLGLGDDAAVLDWATSDRCVVTTDLLAAGVHFVDDEQLNRVGYKALAVNLSDLAAMAARPIAAFVSLLLPVGFSKTDLCELYDGMSRLAAEFDVAIAGGDTNAWDGGLVISVVAVGDCPFGPAWTRSGGQVGDAVVITGQLGGSIEGHHLDFRPRLSESESIARAHGVHAAIDVSDGLLLDLSRLAFESGCGAKIDLETIPISSAAHTLAERTGRSALDHALGDGEDFELLLCLNKTDAAKLCRNPPTDVTITELGELISTHGLYDAKSGAALKPAGFEHKTQSPP